VSNRAFAPTPAQKHVLEALATYQMLNASQMHRLGVARDIRDVRHALHGLDGCRWIRKTGSALISGVKRLPALYWITTKGAAGAAALGIEATGSDRELGTEQEIEHRIGIVEVHMALRAWAASAGATVDEVVVDFEATGPVDPDAEKKDRLRKATSIVDDDSGFLYVPDMLAWVTPPGEPEPQLLVVEVERGGAAANLSKFRSVKLPRILRACQTDLAERAFGAAHAARFLVIFQHGNMKRRALEKWIFPDVPEWELFFVKSLDELHDFNGGWAQPFGAVVSLF
jgi:hypothetical protein